MRGRAVPVVMLWTVACAGADPTPMVRMQAAKDFVCAESTVRVQRDPGGTYTAVGCGKHGTYTAVCEGTRCAVSQQGGGMRGPAPRGVAPEPGPRDGLP